MFTIGICSSDREQYLYQALQSVLAQTYAEPFQVVISDDNSKNFSVKDSLSKVAKQFKDRNIQLRLVTQQSDGDVKSGEGAMRNNIVDNSTGEFIVWLDDDDRLLPNSLSLYAQAIKELPQIDVFFGNLIRTDHEFKAQNRYQYRDIPRVLLPSSLLLGSIIPNGGSCIKKSVFDRIGKYDPSFQVATDYQFWARASLGPVNFKHLNHDVYLYRSHENNAALDKEDERFFNTNGRVCELLLRSCPPNVLFPFFEWKTDKSLADCQVTLAILTLAKRNRNNFLADNCFRELGNNQDIKPHLSKVLLNEVFENLSAAADLTFDQTAQLMSKIVEAGRSESIDKNSTSNQSNLK